MDAGRLLSVKQESHGGGGGGGGGAIYGFSIKQFFQSGIYCSTRQGVTEFSKDVSPG